MQSWMLVPEYLALLLNGILAANFYDRTQAPSRSRKLFWGCLATSMGSSLLNILTVWMDESTRVYAGPGTFLLNSLYFAVTLAMTFFVTLYLLMRMLEFSSKKRDLAVALALLAAAAAVHLVVLVLNARTGWLFYFDDLGDYRRGPLNKTPHLAPVFQTAVIAWCYLRHRDTISRAVANVASSVPALAIVLIALQFLFPDLYLTGTFAATVNLVLYLNFQSCKIEQDPLTGLGSRSSFVTELRHRLYKGQGFQALLVSMRNFSEINQVYGHGAGDAVLLQVSQRLEGLVEGGFAYRFGGDQFAALLSPLPSAQREARLYGIVSALRSPWVVDGHEVRIRVATAELSYNGEDWAPEDVINRLEFSQAVARSEGLELSRFDAEAATRYDKREKLERGLHRALEEDRFEV